MTMKLDSYARLSTNCIAQAV